MGPNIQNRFDNIAKSKTFKNIVKTFDLTRKSVLDIGCSYGEFLVHFGKGSVGVTIDKGEVEYGKSKGLDIRVGNIESKSFVLEEKFDAIFANNIIEHLFSPHEFLIKIKKYLKPEGFIILGVPCVPKFVSLLHFSKFRGSMAVSHINFFTRNTLIKTVESAGFDVKEVRGFRLNDNLFDHLLDFIYPHFYVMAVPKKDFEYSDKILRELAGY